MSGESIADIRAGLDRVQNEFGEIQAAIAVVKDKADGVVSMIGILGEGSERAELGTVRAAAQGISEKMDEAISATFAGVEALQTWSGAL